MYFFFLAFVEYTVDRIRPYIVTVLTNSTQELVQNILFIVGSRKAYKQ